ncbi:MAG: hypothetical protein OEY70_03480 [Acidimicrobiia bacterium]|nr:hypothetical protein [Acidimicrobiia bacterium]
MSWRAAVDVGSVAAKILLTDGTERVRLGVDTLLGGARLAANGETTGETLAGPGLDRLEGALGRFRELVDRHQPSSLQAVTTAPGRFAANPEVLSELVDRHLGVPLTVLDGTTEARLAFAGAASDPALMRAGAGGASGPPPLKVVTIDLGGASTELAAGPLGAAAASHVWSAPIGGRSITAAYIHSDPPRADELSAALSIIELHIDDVRREAPELLTDVDSAVVVGLGAVVTLAAIEVGLVDGDPNTGSGDGPLHGFVLTREAAEDVFRTIATESRADRVHNPGLPPTRVDEIVGAGAVLVETMRQLGLARLVVSQRGVLDGLLAEAGGADAG